MLISPRSRIHNAPHPEVKGKKLDFLLRLRAVSSYEFIRGYLLSPPISIDTDEAIRIVEHGLKLTNEFQS